MPDVDLAVILADGEYLKRESGELVGAVPATGAGFTAEDAVDATAAAFAAGTHTNVTVTYNDAANSISLGSPPQRRPPKPSKPSPAPPTPWPPPTPTRSSR